MLKHCVNVNSLKSEFVELSVIRRTLDNSYIDENGNTVHFKLLQDVKSKDYLIQTGTTEGFEYDKELFVEVLPNSRFMYIWVDTNERLENLECLYVNSSMVVEGYRNIETRRFDFNNKVGFLYDSTNKVVVIDVPFYERLQMTNAIRIDNGYQMIFEDSHFFHNNDNNIKIYVYDGTYKEIKCTYLSYNSLVYIGDSDILSDFGNYSFFRSEFKVSDADIFTINLQKAQFVIPIVLPQDFQTDMFQEQIVTENFIEKEKEKAINPIIDLEKDMYIPVYRGNDDRDSLTVSRILFNLHFRDRTIESEKSGEFSVDTENWLAKKDSFWNKDLKTTVGGDLSSVSDLLFFLGFDKNDVRFQKQRLRKSFLRLLFYDSMNQTNQNLLHTSTIFMDTGKLFGKFCRYGEVNLKNKGFAFNVVNENDSKVNGIGVNTEPTTDMLSEFSIEEGNVLDSLEELRLSSQFEVNDRYDTSSSSEGFYLYLFKEDDPKLIEREIYMKVEFNHAGYGRTLPLMQPKDDNGKILSYSEVVGLYEDLEEAISLKKYYSYTYIKVKVVYDKVLNRHVYYLPEQDEYVWDEDTRTLRINLYEAKIE